MLRRLSERVDVLNSHKLPSSKAFYLIVIGLILFLLSVIVHHLSLINGDLKLNLYSEFFGIFLTSIVFVAILEIKDKRERKPLKVHAKERVEK